MLRGRALAAWHNLEMHMINPHTEWIAPSNQLQARSYPLNPWLAHSLSSVVECVKVRLHNFIKITVKNFTYAPHRHRRQGKASGKPHAGNVKRSKFKREFSKGTPCPVLPLGCAQLSIGIQQVPKIFLAWKWLSLSIRPRSLAAKLA